MKYAQSNVTDFHKEFGITINTIPRIPDKKEQELRIRLIEEELMELNEAFERNDMVEVADAIADLLYVVLGCSVTCGIDIEPVFNEVHRSNMTKKGGHKALNGKWIKPATYDPANILPILNRQGYKKEISAREE